MNEKKQSGKKRLFLLVLVAFGIVLWITFTNLNRIALRHTLDETIGFVKIRLEQYETDAANDRVKSLVRLLDKTVSLGNEMTLKESFGTQDLDSFAEEQRLTGALVLDENLNVVMQTTKGFPVERFSVGAGGIATITENGRVISSNSSKQVNKAIEDCQELYNGTFGAAEDGIVRLNSNQGVWYGSRENTENYTLFVFFPASRRS